MQFFVCCGTSALSVGLLFFDAQLDFLRQCLFRRYVRICFKKILEPGVHVGFRTGVRTSGCVGVWVVFFSSFLLRALGACVPACLPACLRCLPALDAEGDVFFAVASEVADELERAQNDQDRLQDELDCSCEDLAAATREFSNCWAAQEATVAAATAAAIRTSIAFREVCTRRAAHEAICAEARKAWQRAYDLKMKASEAQDKVRSHGERTRRISNEQEAHVNDGLGSLGQAERAAAKATHCLTCGVPSRESDEVRYLREATELTEGWLMQLQGGRPVSGPPSVCCSRVPLCCLELEFEQVCVCVFFVFF